MNTVQEMLSKRLIDVIDATQKRIDELRKTARQIEILEERTEQKFCKSVYDISYPTFEIERKDLPLVRKAVGRLTIDSKTVPCDFDTSNKIEVTVRPHDERMSNLRFRYRTEIKSGSKCQVVEQKTSYKTLVCGG